MAVPLFLIELNKLVIKFYKKMQILLHSNISKQLIFA